MQGVKEQTQNHIQDNKQIDLPDPVFYNYIEFQDNGQLIRYTDCYQISMLRFLHLVFGNSEGKIISEKLIKYMDLNNKHCQLLISYFEENPTFQMRQDFYKTQDGFKIRSLWAQFLNKCGLLDLKHGNKYEVKATVSNILRFFKGFFPKLSFNISQVQEMTHKNVISGQIFKEYENALVSIYNQLSFEYKITLETDYVSGDNQMTLLQLWFDQKIFINQQHRLDWGINEFYQLDGQQVKQRVGGHSDYRYHLIPQN